MTQLRWAGIAAIVIVGLVLYLLLADARDERRPSRRAVGTASHAATALEAESQETADAAASRSHATMRVLLASGRPAAGASVAGVERIETRSWASRATLREGIKAFLETRPPRWARQP